MVNLRTASAVTPLNANSKPTQTNTVTIYTVHLMMMPAAALPILIDILNNRNRKLSMMMVRSLAILFLFNRVRMATIHLANQIMAPRKLSSMQEKANAIMNPMITLRNKFPIWKVRFFCTTLLPNQLLLGPISAITTLAPLVSYRGCQNRSWKLLNFL